MEFDRNTRVDIATAKQDRISLNLGDWIYDGDDSAFRMFIMALENSDWPNPNNTSPTLSPLCRSQRHGNKSSLKFTSRRVGGAQRAGAPLIDGKIVFQKTRFNDFGPARYIGKAEISINPTRALVHQPINNSIIQSILHQSEIEPTFLDVDMRSSALGEPVRTERLLNSMSDNVLIDRQWQMMARPEYWIRHLASYIAETFRLINHLVNEAFRGGDGGELQFRGAINLKEVETYWEFSTPDPVRTAYELVPQFRALGTNSRVREYINVDNDFEVEGNVPILSTQLRTGLRAKLYPKTTRRLRLETTHDLSKFNQLGHGHEFSSITEFTECILELAENSASEVNDLLAVLCSALPPRPPQRSAYELVREILRSADSSREQDTLMSLIINNCGYRLLPGDPLRSAVLTLQSRGVLRRTRPHSRSLCLTEEYLGAREVLAYSAEANERPETPPPSNSDEGT